MRLLVVVFSRETRGSFGPKPETAFKEKGGYMHRTIILFILVFGGMLVSPSTSRAGDDELCIGDDNDQSIAACTRLLQSAEGGPAARRAAIFFNRGISFARKKNEAKALSDLRTAIQLDPTNTQYR